MNAQECDIEPLTRIEENALRYAAGYVCKNVARKLKKSSFLIILYIVLKDMMVKVKHNVIHPFGLMSLIGVVSGVLTTQCSLFSMQWKKMSRGTLSIKVQSRCH